MRSAYYTESSKTPGCVTSDEDVDSHSRRGSGRGLYANVDQSPLSTRGHVTPLDQWGPYDGELSFSYYWASCYKSAVCNATHDVSVAQAQNWLIRQFTA